MSGVLINPWSEVQKRRLLIEGVGELAEQVAETGGPQGCVGIAGTDEMALLN